MTLAQKNQDHVMLMAVDHVFYPPPPPPPSNPPPPHHQFQVNTIQEV